MAGNKTFVSLLAKLICFFSIFAGDGKV